MKLYIITSPRVRLVEKLKPFTRLLLVSHFTNIVCEPDIMSERLAYCLGLNCLKIWLNSWQDHTCTSCNWPCLRKMTKTLWSSHRNFNNFVIPDLKISERLHMLCNHECMFVTYLLFPRLLIHTRTCYRVACSPSAGTTQLQAICYNTSYKVSTNKQPPLYANCEMSSHSQKTKNKWTTPSWK